MKELVFRKPHFYISRLTDILKQNIGWLCSDHSQERKRCRRFLKKLPPLQSNLLMK